MLTIVALEKEHIKEVARLHLDHLPTSFRGTSGLRLLTGYYLAVSGGQGGCGYVALENGDIAGYVCGVWDMAILRTRLIRRQGASLLFWGAMQGFNRPRVFVQLVRRLRPRREPIAKRFSQAGYELRPIVVAPAYRGTPVAEKLAQRIIGDAAARGFDSVHLYAEAGNAAANRFYRKIGFEKVDTYQSRRKTYA